MFQPYKTSVVNIIQTTLPDGKPVLELETYKIRDPDQYWLGAHEPELLESLTASQLEQLPNACNLVYEWDESKQEYRGYTKPGKQCIIFRRGVKSYLESTCGVDNDSYMSWDVGRDPETDEFVWGGEVGPFLFLPSKRFDHLVPEYPSGGS
mmetsp:Transcript_17747/g.36851  ORF Transcript_17747/g.36851 Transcript_17747/m.36851 type:complete len:151 (+) Transcript_17747:95-547(+)